MPLVIILATCWKTEKIYIYSHLRILYDYMCFFFSLFVSFIHFDDISAVNFSTYPIPYHPLSLSCSFFSSLHSFTKFLYVLFPLFLFQFLFLSCESLSQIIYCNFVMFSMCECVYVCVCACDRRMKLMGHPFFLHFWLACADASASARICVSVAHAIYYDMTKTRLHSHEH